MSVRDAHGHASETKRWYRFGSALKPLLPSAVTHDRNWLCLRTKAPLASVEVSHDSFCGWAAAAGDERGAVGGHR